MRSPASSAALKGNKDAVAETIENNVRSKIIKERRGMLLRVRPRTDEDKKRALVEEWYRQRLKEAAPPLIARWEPLLGVSVERLHVRRMKTKWGSCTPGSASIRLNTELARKPRECLEYIIVHEMVHLLEPSHNQRFVALMDQFLPQWHVLRDILNRLPVHHQSWGY